MGCKEMGVAMGRDGMGWDRAGLRRDGTGV